MNHCLSCDADFPTGPVCPSCGYTPAKIDGFPAFAPELAATAPGYDPSHYRKLAGLEKDHFWFRGRNRIILDAIRRYQPVPERILEIGCGTGFVLDGMQKAFPGARLLGSEIYVEGLAIARERVVAAEFCQLDATRLPFANEFDVIGAFDVLEHIPDDALALGQIRQALRVGGIAVLTVPQHMWLWSAQDELAHHQRRYERGELQERIAQSGLRLLWSSSFVSLLLPLMAVARWRSNNGRIASNPYAEFMLPGWMNSLMFAAMKLESLMLRAGLRFPAGGSRIAVARKETA